MIKNLSVLAVIPARSGSKGLPGKNVINLLGKPLITWSIEVAKACKAIDFVYLSTDSNEIASIGRENGLFVPHLRPEYLATDEASSIDVVLHAIDESEKVNKFKFDIIVLLEPTSPLRDVFDIDNAIKKLVETNKAKAITGVSRVENQHPDFIVSLKDGFQQSYIMDETSLHKRRQELSDLYFHEGSLYIAYTDFIKEKKTFYSTETLGFELPKWKSLEIDDLYDFYMVEALMKRKLLGDL